MAWGRIKASALKDPVAETPQPMRDSVGMKGGLVTSANKRKDVRLFVVVVFFFVSEKNDTRIIPLDPVRRMRVGG